MRIRSSLWTLAVALSAAGCTGVVDDPAPGGPGATNQSGSGGVGAGGSTQLPPVPDATQRGGTRVQPTTTLDGGRVVLRRLNRAEYDNTMRDLLGSMSNPARTTPFAADDVADGFDTLGQNLVMSLFLAEQMDGAANILVDELFARPAGDAWRARVLPCEPTVENFSVCATQVLTAFMNNAFRRPVAPDEVQARVTLGSSVLQSSGNARSGLGAALKSVLMSPHFVYRVELGDPNSPEATPLSDYELATRLSYFLWASMPDAALFEAAGAKKLTSSPDGLSAQVQRLLADPKSQGFIEGFAGQWLATRASGQFVASKEQFPDYDDALRLSLPQETNLFFQALIAEKQPLTSLVLADFSFVNDRLARHYGVPVTQSGFARTSLAGTPRMGVLSHASVLAFTSYAHRTSPVRRADWVLENLLCDPPPVPAMVPPFDDTPKQGTTLRQQFEEHRANPACAACHKIMDPIGFALEGYDAVGAYRTQENGVAVDTTGQLADGTPLADARDLAEAIAKDADYAICVAKQALTYAVGRSFSEAEARNYAGGLGVMMKDATWPAFIEAVVQSEAFRTRRGQAL